MALPFHFSEFCYLLFTTGFGTTENLVVYEWYL
jgi:hypothetical protein